MGGPGNKGKDQRLLGPIASPPLEAQALLGKLPSEQGPGSCLLLGRWPELALDVAQGGSRDKGLLGVSVRDGHPGWNSGMCTHICSTVCCPAASLSRRKGHLPRRLQLQMSTCSLGGCCRLGG